MKLSQIFKKSYQQKLLIQQSKQLFAKKKATPAKGASSSSSPKQSAQFGRQSTGSTLKMGIVGMANVGKSTTFNLISKQQVAAENFPFCTIDPNSAIVQIPDERFKNIVNLYEPRSEIGACIQITDIAGLVQGASEGEGLGNEFLSHIKSVDGIYQVVRAFENDKIIHTEGFMDPIRDLKIIKNELIQKDLQFLDKNFADVNKKAERTKNPELVAASNTMKKSIQLLNEGKWLRNELWTKTEVQILNKYHLLSTKPITYLVNQSEQDYQEGNCKFDKEIEQWVNEQQQQQKQNSTEEENKQLQQLQIIKYSAEYELLQEMNNVDSPKLDEIVLNGYKLLNLIHYFTVGKDECRCWTVMKNSTAPQAASVIHTDFEKGFVSADVLSYEDFNAVGIENMKKKVRKEGKDYIVQDGDIINFKCKISK